MKSFDYTISSTDCDRNSTIHANLSNPQTEYCKMTITSLTTMANIVVLAKGDYFVINGTRYVIDDDYSDVSASSLTEYLNILISNVTENEDLSFYCDRCSRIYIWCRSDFTFDECSYNMRLLLGLTNVELPLHATAATTWYIFSIEFRFEQLQKFK